MLDRLNGCMYINTHEREWVMERDSRKIITRLKKEGFELVSVRGSHHKFRKGSIVVIVPHPKKDIPLGTVRSIARDAGWI